MFLFNTIFEKKKKRILHVLLLLLMLYSGRHPHTHIHTYVHWIDTNFLVMATNHGFDLSISFWVFTGLLCNLLLILFYYHQFLLLLFATKYAAVIYHRLHQPHHHKFIWGKSRKKLTAILKKQPGISFFQRLNIVIFVLFHFFVPFYIQYKTTLHCTVILFFCELFSQQFSIQLCSFLQISIQMWMWVSSFVRCV